MNHSARIHGNHEATPRETTMPFVMGGKLHPRLRNVCNAVRLKVFQTIRPEISAIHFPVADWRQRFVWYRWKSEHPHYRLQLLLHLSTICIHSKKTVALCSHEPPWANCCWTSISICKYLAFLRHLHLHRLRLLLLSPVIINSSGNFHQFSSVFFSAFLRRLH